MKRFGIYLGLCICAVMVSVCCADELPLWEAGLGFTGLSIPDYRGSNERHGYVLPVPYVVYRGEILRWDRKGIYGRLFESDRIHLNISADAGVPVTSDANSARFGMPDLDTAVQIGPALEVCLLNNCDNDRIVQFRLPVRAVIAVDFYRASGIGFITNPQLNVDFLDIGPGGGWNFGFMLGPLFATEHYHDYYYQVSPQYAVPLVRPTYNAQAGYSGSLLVFALSRRFEHVWFGSFVRYDDLTSAVIRDSPLVMSENSLMAGFILSWVFGKSATQVHTSVH